MSVYCTLPRGEKSSSIFDRRKTWSNVVRQENELSENGAAENGQFSVDGTRELECSSAVASNGLMRNYSSEVCLNQLPDSSVNQRLYYAVDSFEDLKALRRSSIASLSPDYSPESSPNFYGDSDSAYDSSNESLRLGKEQRKHSSKYFTLPTKLGRKLKKLNLSQEYASNSTLQSPSTPTAKQPTVDRTGDVNCVNNQSNSHQTSQKLCDQQRTQQQKTICCELNEQALHCCCQLGCHEKSSSPSAYDRNYNPQCCQQTLETLWEEPASNGYETQRNMTLFENTLSSMSSKLHRLNLINRQKDIEIAQLRAFIDSLNLNNEHSSHQSAQKWLKSAFKRSKLRTKMTSSQMNLNAIYATKLSLSDCSQNYYYSNLINDASLPPLSPASPPSPSSTLYSSEIVFKLQDQLHEKEKAIKSLNSDAINYRNQIKSLNETVEKIRADCEFISKENQMYKGILSSSNQNSINSITEFPDDDSQKGRKVFVYLGAELIGSARISPKTNWDQLDSIVVQIFSSTSFKRSATNLKQIERWTINYYEVGIEKVRRFLSDSYNNICPELLPFGYLVEDNSISLAIQEKIY